MHRANNDSLITLDAKSAAWSLSCEITELRDHKKSHAKASAGQIREALCRHSEISEEERDADR